MKRYLCALGVAVTLALGTGAGNAVAGGSLLGGSQTSNQSESVSNQTDQNASQFDPTLNVPVNVAVLNSGGTSQSNGGVSQSNGNANATGQDVSQGESSTQSGSGSGTGSDSQQAGAGPSSSQTESTSNSTDQDAGQLDPTANVPVNVAVANGGSQPNCGCETARNQGGGSPGGVSQSNGGVDQANGNLNATGQSANQGESSTQSQPSGAGAPKADGCGCGGRSNPDGNQGGSQSSVQDESVSNETGQSADQLDPTVNAPVNVAVPNDGAVHQSNGGVDQQNGNANLTAQDVSQHESSTQAAGGNDGPSWSDGKGGYGKNDGDDGSQSTGQTESVSNDASQTAGQLDPTANVPVNVAVANGGSQPNCGCDTARNQGGGSPGGVSQSNGGVDQANGNLNATSQHVWESESSSQSSTAGNGQGQDRSGPPCCDHERCDEQHCHRQRCDQERCHKPWCKRHDQHSKKDCGQQS